MSELLSNEREFSVRMDDPHAYGAGRGTQLRVCSTHTLRNHDRLIRCMDLLIAALALVFFGPLMIAISLGVRLASPGPALFRQQRIGHGGQVFICYKFRSMRADAETYLAALLQKNAALRMEWARDHKLRNDPRVGWLGNLLRRTSLDELPQLLNVLKGDMSIVGPRPIIELERARYGRYIAAYYAVRPGITGLWQVSGRSGTTYRRRIACDILYSRSRSAWSNLRIMIMTVPAVMVRRGAY